MPFFGDYETVGQPYATTVARTYDATIWRVRKSGASASQRPLALKCISPRHHHTDSESEAADALAPDRRLEYIGVFKQIKQAQGAGGRGLAPVHDFGTAEEGAWYVTDFYERFSLKSFVLGKGTVDEAALRQVIHSVATGCLALKRACGRSHGNLKLSNILRGGRSQPLRRTPLLLADPAPGAGAGFEAEDLKALGEILLQLVEGRVVESVYDYNYPIASSSAWEGLGKGGGNWRKLCNDLLDPHLSLAQFNLESLAAEYKSRNSLPMLAAVGGVLAVAGVAGGFYLSRSHVAGGEATPANPPVAANPGNNSNIIAQTPPATPTATNTDDANAAAARQREGQYEAAMRQAQQYLDAQDYTNALAQATAALSFKGGDEAALQLQQTAQGKLKDLLAAQQREQQYQAAMRRAQQYLDAQDYTNALAQAQVALSFKDGDATALKLQHTAQGKLDDLAARQRDQQYEAAVQQAQTDLTASNYPGAITQTKVALSIRDHDTAALQLQQQAQKGLDDMDATQRRDQQYQAAVQQAQKFLDAQDYTNALAQAGLALSLKDQDPAALQLQEKAQGKLNELAATALREQQYQAAMQQAQKDLDAQDYTNAVAQAKAALSFKDGDAAALQLQQTAQGKLNDLAAAQQREQQYQAAMRQAQKDLDAQDYTNVLVQVKVALSFKDGDAAALQLQQTAQVKLDGLAAAARLDQQYEAAMRQAQQYLDTQNYTDAVVQAKLALSFKNGDAAAFQLQQTAQGKLDEIASAAQRDQQYQAAMRRAQQYLDTQDYADAVAQAKLALSFKDGDAAALDLRKLAQTGLDHQAVLAKAQAQFNSGDYGYTNDPDFLKLAAQPPFDELLKQAGAESAQVAQLTAYVRGNDWKSLNAAIGAVAPKLLDKPNFAAVKNWWANHDPGKEVEKQLEEANAIFSSLGLPKIYPRAPGAPGIDDANARLFGMPISMTRLQQNQDYYQQLVEAQKEAHPSILTDPQKKNFDALIKAIKDVPPPN